MNREILFRGQRWNTKEMIEGLLFQDVHGVYINNKLILSDSMNWDFIQVDAETVGQYTGLKDKNGKKIFEGDILLYVEELDGEYTCGQKHWHLQVLWENNGWFLLSKCENAGGELEEFSDYDEDYELQIIGNIHTNPELLEQS